MGENWGLGKLTGYKVGGTQTLSSQNHSCGPTNFTTIPPLHFSDLDHLYCPYAMLDCSLLQILEKIKEDFFPLVILPSLCYVGLPSLLLFPLAETFQSGNLYARQKIKGDQTLDSGQGLTRGEGWIVFSKSILLLIIDFFVSWPPMYTGFQRVRHKRCAGTEVETWFFFPSTKGTTLKSLSYDTWKKIIKSHPLVTLQITFLKQRTGCFTKNLGWQDPCKYRRICPSAQNLNRSNQTLVLISSLFAYPTYSPNCEKVVFCGLSATSTLCCKTLSGLLFLSNASKFYFLPFSSNKAHFLV